MAAPEGFTEEEWETVREAPALAGLMVVTSEKGGTFRESFALAKAYADARREHGASKLLDEVASAGPARQRRYRSVEELHDRGLAELGEAAAVVKRARGEEELGSYRRFVVDLAERVARAHRETDDEVSPSERSAIDSVAASLEG